MRYQPDDAFKLPLMTTKYLGHGHRCVVTRSNPLRSCPDANCAPVGGTQALVRVRLVALMELTIVRNPFRFWFLNRMPIAIHAPPKTSNCLIWQWKQVCNFCRLRESYLVSCALLWDQILVSRINWLPALTISDLPQSIQRHGLAIPQLGFHRLLHFICRKQLLVDGVSPRCRSRSLSCDRREEF